MEPLARKPRAHGSVFTTDSGYLGGEMEAQELESWRAQSQQREMLEPENRDVDARHVEPPQSMAAQIEALEAEDEAPAAEACASDADADAEHSARFGSADE